MNSLLLRPRRTIRSFVMRLVMFSWATFMIVRARVCAFLHFIHSFISTRSTKERHAVPHRPCDAHTCTRDSAALTFASAASQCSSKERPQAAHQRTTPARPRPSRCSAASRAEMRDRSRYRIQRRTHTHRIRTRTEAAAAAAAMDSVPVRAAAPAGPGRGRSRRDRRTRPAG